MKLSMIYAWSVPDLFIDMSSDSFIYHVMIF